MTEPTHFSLAKVAHLFRCGPSKIRDRCRAGEFDYEIDANGRWHITRESVMKHMKELEMKHNG